MIFSSATRNIKLASSLYLYFHSLVQWPVHKSIERQEKGANRVEESIPIFTVPIESENQGQTMNPNKSFLQYKSAKWICVWHLIPEIEDPGLYNKSEQVLKSFEGCIESLNQDGFLCVSHVVVKHPG